MNKSSSITQSNLKDGSVVNSAVFWVCLSLLVLVPLVFVVSLHRTYVTPKLAILLVGASTLVPLSALSALAAARRGSDLTRFFNPTHVLVVTLYFASITVSTVFGLDPIASLFGFFHNQMGLVPQLCFFTCFIGLILGTSSDDGRLHKVLWAMALAGFLTSAYAVFQFFGYDPFLNVALYTYRSQQGDVRRVIGTLGHADYLGNFLMYTTPVTVALGVGARGRTRSMALIASGVSLAVIVMSGTRGAWLGIVAAAVVVCLLEVKSGRRVWNRMTRRVTIRRAALALAIIAVSVAAMSLSPAARGVAARARSLAMEGFSGSGRTLLWRDSIKMVPAFAFAGSGPDSFRLAFLAYKSKELAQLTDANNESSHNSYLDAAVSYGLPGALLYIAIIASAFRLLLRARGRAPSPHLKIIFTGLLASLVAVATHNFFIFDQLPTGLYFFALIGLAQIASNLAQPRQVATDASAQNKADFNRATHADSVRAYFKVFEWAAVVAGCALIGTAVWYSLGVLRADLAINKALAYAENGDLDRVIEHGKRATSSPELTGDYDLVLSGAFGICSSQLEAISNAARKSGDESQIIVQASNRARELASAHAQKSLRHIFSPELSYLFLASLAQSAGNTVKVRESAAEAIRWDPNNFRARLMLAKSHLAGGNPEQAAREAEMALELHPFSPEAASALARARGDDATDDSAAIKIMAQMRNSKPNPNLKLTVEELIQLARQNSHEGKLQQARIKLVTAIGRADAPCPDCHRELAMLYEKMERYSEAIAEWQTFSEQAPERALAEKIKERIETLRQKGNQRH